MQILQKTSDHRIIAILVFELECEAFGKRACKNTGRIERLQAGEYARHEVRRGTELFTERAKISRQVAGVIDELLSCEELIQNIVAEAEARLAALSAITQRSAAHVGRV